MSKLKYLLIILVVIIFWFQRHIFFDKYQPEYIHDYYSLSQWALPLSSRIMGDADLFSYSGYSLTKDFKPFSINPETPIFAKLLFGYSIRFFGNGHYVSLLFLVLSILGMDVLAKKHFNFDPTKRIFLVIFIFCSAEIQEQLKLTLLDLPQVMLYVWHLIFLFKIKEKNSNSLKHIIISGLLLGFMSATKFAIYTPFILMADIFYLYMNKQLKLTLILLVSALTGFALPYLPTIISEGPTQFIKSQKWIFNFYTGSDVKAPMGMLLITSFTGLMKGWEDSNWRQVYSWNGEWGLGLIALTTYLFSWVKSRKIQNTELAVILGTLTIILGILLIIPFWPRYMIFFVPFFWLLILNYITDKKLLFLLLIFPIISTSKLVLQSYMPPTEYINLYNKAQYEELYNYFSIDYKSEISREEFVTLNINEFEYLHPNKINATIIEQQETGGLKQTLDIELISFHGNKQIIKEITWKRELSQWKIQNINNISEIVTQNPDFNSLVCVNPLKVEDWSSVYAAIGKYYDTSTENAKERVMSLVPRDYCIPIGEVDEMKEEKFPIGVEIIQADRD